jgi:hypothetical protein
MSTNNLCKCGSEIPQKRIELGYKECVKCSKVEVYGCVDVVYHKTGNTIEIMDKASVEQYNKMARRTGFGIMSGLRSGKASELPKTPISNNPVGRDPYLSTGKNFEIIGERAMLKMESTGLEKALEYVKKAVSEFEINQLEGDKLSRILKETHKIAESQNTQKREKSKYNPYGKKEPSLKKEVSEETEWAFKNWRR